VGPLRHGHSGVLRSRAACMPAPGATARSEPPSTIVPLRRRYGSCPAPRTVHVHRVPLDFSSPRPYSLIPCAAPVAISLRVSWGRSASAGPHTISAQGLWHRRRPCWSERPPGRLIRHWTAPTACDNQARRPRGAAASAAGIVSAPLRSASACRQHGAAAPRRFSPLCSA
jgi:hypothetical protein